MPVSSLGSSRSGGVAPNAPADGRGGLSSLSGIFHFEGRVQVMLNTTLKEQRFNVPEEFLGVLPDGFPTRIVVYKSLPSLNGKS